MQKFPKLAYEEDVIKSLGEISGMHKLLYLTLWSRANEIGHIVVNMNEILGLTGIQYQRSDLDYFGNRVVVLDGMEVILSRYLITTIGTLSRKMRGQKKVWDLLWQRWGATKNNILPFVEGWKKLGIGIYVPPFPDEYTGEDNLPAWMVAYRREAELSVAMDAPYTWPEKIASEFKRFVQYRANLLLEQTSRSEATKVRLHPNQVKTNMDVVEDMIRLGLNEDKIVDRIRYPEKNNRIAINAP